MIKTALLTFLVGYLFVAWGVAVLTRLKASQNIREEGPSTHYKKTGTPTMGGVFIIATILISVLLTHPIVTDRFVVVIITMLGFGAVGFFDDWLKVIRGKNLGLRSWQKMLGIIIVSLPVLGYVIGSQGFRYVHPLLSFLHLDTPVGYFLFGLFVMASISNAVNLTDGLDGLAAGSSTITFIAFAFLAFNRGYYSISYFSVIMAAALAAFLWFNHHPARLFMGDVGSLAIGGALGAVALVTHTELNLAIIGGLFVAEAASVVIQVSSFKLTRKRVFRMSPLHHHFELLGWPEVKVVTRFWLVAAALALFGSLL